MSPISILHIDSEKGFRGGQEALLRLARGLAERGHKQLLVTPLGSELEDRARQAGLPVSPFPAGIGSWLRIARGFKILHTHSGRAQTPVWLWSSLLNAIVVATRHVAFEPKNRTIHSWKYGRGADGVIAVSEAVREVLLRADVPDSKIEVIYTGVEVPGELPGFEDRAAARAALGFAAEDFVIGQMGAFTEEKGQDIAIEAAARLESAIPQVRFVLAGDGPLAGDWREKARGLRVDFLGYVADRAGFFSALDLFVMPSRSEAWGLAALEAMAYAVPVIASDVGGLREIVSIAEGGRLVPAGDPEALAIAIREAAADRECLRAAGLKGRERARLFSVQQTIERTEALYRRLLKTQAD